MYWTVFGSRRFVSWLFCRRSFMVPRCLNGIEHAIIWQLASHWSYREARHIAAGFIKYIHVIPFIWSVFVVIGDERESITSNKMLLIRLLRLVYMTHTHIFSLPADFRMSYFAYNALCLVRLSLVFLVCVALSNWLSKPQQSNLWGVLGLILNRYAHESIVFAFRVWTVLYERAFVAAYFAFGHTRAYHVERVKLLYLMIIQHTVSA
jgi:hypothetical protein